MVTVAGPSTTACKVAWSPGSPYEKMSPSRQAARSRVGWWCAGAPAYGAPPGWYPPPGAPGPGAAAGAPLAAHPALAYPPPPASHVPQPGAFTCLSPHQKKTTNRACRFDCCDRHIATRASMMLHVMPACVDRAPTSALTLHWVSAAPGMPEDSCRAGASPQATPCGLLLLHSIQRNV